MQKQNELKHIESAYRAIGVSRADAGGVRSDRAAVVALELALLDVRSFPASGESKTPGLPRFQFRATHDARIIGAWHSRFAVPGRETNWLVLTGRDGGVWIIDVDGPQGREDLERLEAELGPLPRTWTTESGRIGGGEHRWFKPSPGSDVELRNQQHMFGYSIDVRAWHGYAVLPGSVHATTRLRYRWREGCAPGECELAELPPAWLEFLPKKIFGGEQGASGEHRERRASRPSDRAPHIRGSRVIGDGEGGFQNAIYLNAIDWWRDAGTDAPKEQLIATLWELIQAAPKSAGRSVERYRPGNGDLERAVRRARDFVEGLNVEYEEQDSG